MLPGNKYLISGRQENNIRIYRKNHTDKENFNAVRIWIGDYSAADTFEELAEEADGIKRLGVYRADVDNLGNAFVAGFRNNKNGKNESSLAATAASFPKPDIVF